MDKYILFLNNFLLSKEGGHFLMLSAYFYKCLLRTSLGPSLGSLGSFQNPRFPRLPVHLSTSATAALFVCLHCSNYWKSQSSFALWDFLLAVKMCFSLWFHCDSVQVKNERALLPCAVRTAFVRIRIACCFYWKSNHSKTCMSSLFSLINSVPFLHSSGTMTF